MDRSNSENWPGAFYGKPCPITVRFCQGWTTTARRCNKSPWWCRGRSPGTSTKDPGWFLPDKKCYVDSGGFQQSIDWSGIKWLGLLFRCTWHCCHFWTHGQIVDGDKLNCSGNFSPRGIAIQLQVNGEKIELVPRHASYFDWESVEFPRFLGSNNRSKNDASLELFLSDNEGARVVIRELKAAFEDSLVPNFLLEHLVKRVAMMSLNYDVVRGFVFKIPLDETYELLCSIFAELATFESHLVMQQPAFSKWLL